MKKHFAGIIIGFVGLILIITVSVMKIKDDIAIEEAYFEKGDCFTDDFSCPMEDRNLTPYLFGWTLGIIIIFLGVYVSMLEGINLKLIKKLKK